MSIIRFPDDMVGIPSLVDDDKVLVSDSEDAKVAKWWNLLSIRTWLAGFFPVLDASNVLTTDLAAWQSQLDIAMLKGSIGDATITDIRTIDENGFFATGASSSNLPATNKVGILNVVISGTDKHLVYTTDVLNLLEQWNLVYNGAWGVWVKVTTPAVLYTPDGTAVVVYTDNSGRVNPMHIYSTGDTHLIIDSSIYAPHISYRKAGVEKYALVLERDTPVYGGASNDWLIYNDSRSKIDFLVQQTTGYIGVGKVPTHPLDVNGHIAYDTAIVALSSSTTLNATHKNKIIEWGV